MEINFKLNCIPPKKTHQSAMRIFKNKEGRAFLGHDKKGSQTQSDLMQLLLPYQPASPLQGEIVLSVDWIYPWRSAEPKKNRVKGFIPCVTKPDCDNLAKQLQDCMTKLRFWQDDAQIYSLNFRKFYGDNVGIHVKIYAIND